MLVFLYPDRSRPNRRSVVSHGSIVGQMDLFDDMQLRQVLDVQALGKITQLQAKVVGSTRPTMLGKPCL